MIDVREVLIRSARRGRAPEIARQFYDDALQEQYAFERARNPLRAHAAKLRARYWGRRAFGPWDQPMEYGAPYRLKTDALRAAEIVAVSAFSP